MRSSLHFPAHLSVCFGASLYIQVQTSSTPAQSDIPGWLRLNQRCWSSCRRRHWTLSSLMVNTWQN